MLAAVAFTARSLWHSDNHTICCDEGGELARHPFFVPFSVALGLAGITEANGESNYGATRQTALAEIFTVLWTSSPMHNPQSAMLKP